MSEWKKYDRITNIAEMRNLTETEKAECLVNVSVSDEDDRLPRDEFVQGKIACNPENHKDQWYVAKKYYEENFKPHRVE